MAFVQTAGSHRPYTIPEDNAGFEIATPSTEELTAAGFINPEQF